MSPACWTILRCLTVVAVLAMPTVAVATPGNQTAGPLASPEAREPVVDLNRAGVDELCTLPGIGKKKAEAIVALRQRRPFTRVTQLLQIKGIGHKTLVKLKPRVTVGPTMPTMPTVPTAS